MSRRALTIAAVLSLAVTACNDDDSAESATSTVAEPSSTPPTTDATTTSSSTSTSTSSTTTTSTAPPTTPPSSIAADDWEAILEELDRRVVNLYAEPDLSRIGEYCAPTSDCARGLETQLGDAIAKGQHIEGQQPFDVLEILQASVGEQDPGAPAIAGILFVVAPTPPPPARLVDASGNVVDELALTTTRTKGRFTLVAWDDPALPWRVVLAEDLGPVS